VGNGQRDLLVAVGALQVVEGGVAGGVKGGPAARVDLIQGRLQVLEVRGESPGRIQVVDVVEIDDERLVLHVRRLDKRQGGGVDAGTLLPHAAAVVNHDAHGDRDVGVGEYRELLGNPVLINTETVSPEVVHRTAASPVKHRSVQNDQ